MSFKLEIYIFLNVKKSGHGPPFPLSGNKCVQHTRHNENYSAKDFHIFFTTGDPFPFMEKLTLQKGVDRSTICLPSKKSSDLFNESRDLVHRVHHLSCSVHHFINIVIAIRCFKLRHHTCILSL